MRINGPYGQRCRVLFQMPVCSDSNVSDKNKRFNLVSGDFFKRGLIPGETGLSLIQILVMVNMREIISGFHHVSFIYDLSKDQLLTGQ